MLRAPRQVLQVLSRCYREPRRWSRAASIVATMFLLLAGVVPAPAQGRWDLGQTAKTAPGAPVQGALLSDTFDRANAVAGALGKADLGLGGSGTHTYASIFAGNLTHIISNALQNTGLDFSGVQIVNESGRGEDLGQDLNIRLDLMVPKGAAGLTTQAGPYFRSRAAGTGDGIIGGSNAGYWVQLFSTGEVKVKDLNTGIVTAFSGPSVSFDATVPHTLDIAAKGSDLQVSLDGRLQTFSQAGVLTTSVAIPATGGSNNGVVGIAFAAEDNRGRLGGQRADNLVVYAHTSLSGLPVQNNLPPPSVSPTATVPPTIPKPTPTPSIVAPTAAPTSARLKGDYNRDGKITARDALAALKMALGQIAPDLNLDMNNDKQVSADDARLILIQAAVQTAPVNVASSQTIDPGKGGELTFSGTGTALDQVKVEIPPAAVRGQKPLALNVSLSPDSPSANTVPVGSKDTLLTEIGPTVKIEPGSPPVFDKPIQVTVPLDLARLPIALNPKSIAVLVASTDSSGRRQWDLVTNTTLDIENNRVTFQLTHLSEATALAQDGAEDLVKDILFTAVDELGGYVLDKYGAPLWSMRARNLERALVGERISAYANAGNVVSSFGIDPMMEYVTHPDDEALDAAVLKFLEGIRDAAFPELGLVIKAGKVVIGTAEYTVEQMYAAADIQQRDTLIAGPSGARILGFMEPLRNNSFFGSVKGVTAENVGEKFQSEADLKERWNFWRGQLSLPSVQREIDAAWPDMLNHWKNKRAIILSDKLREGIKERARQTARRFEERRNAFPTDKSAATPTPTPSGRVVYKLSPTPGISHSTKPTSPDVSASISSTSASYSYPEPSVGRVTYTVSWTLPPEIEPGHSYAVGFKTTAAIARDGKYTVETASGTVENYPNILKDPFFRVITVFSGPQFIKDSLAFFQYSPDDGKTWRPPLLTATEVWEKYYQAGVKQVLLPNRVLYKHISQYSPPIPSRPLPLTTAPEETYLEFRLTPGYTGPLPDKIFISMSAEAAGLPPSGGYSVAAITFTYLKQ